MSDTTNNDELIKAIDGWALKHQVSLPRRAMQQGADKELFAIVKKYGIKERIDTLKQLKQSYHDNIVSDDRMDLEIDEAINALKEQETK